MFTPPPPHTGAATGSLHNPWPFVPQRPDSLTRTELTQWDRWKHKTRRQPHLTAMREGSNKGVSPAAFPGSTFTYPKARDELHPPPWWTALQQPWRLNMGGWWCRPLLKRGLLYMREGCCKHLTEAHKCLPTCCCCTFKQLKWWQWRVQMRMIRNGHGCPPP